MGKTKYKHIVVNTGKALIPMGINVSTKKGKKLDRMISDYERMMSGRR